MKRRHWLLAPALALGGWPALAPALAPAAAAALPLAYCFSAGWRSGGAQGHTWVALGVVYRGDDGWCAEIEAFSGRANLPLVPLSERHAMHTPSGQQQCFDGPIKTVNGMRTEERGVGVSIDADGLRWRLGGRAFEWRRDALGGFVLAELGDPGTADGAVDQAVGFAYEADEFSSAFGSPQDLGAFDGEIQHKNANSTAGAPWEHKRSTMDFARFAHVRPGSAVRNFAVPGQAHVVARYGKPMWVQHGLLLLPPASPRLRWLLHEYGHDFNHNGCFDEQGHNKLMLPVLQRGQVEALVYVEYTPDPRDGVPMVSVGRYFKRKANRPA